MITLQIENVNICNAACSFCTYVSEENAQRAKGVMPMDFYRKIIDEAAGLPAIDEVYITGLGEPTIDPTLVAKVAYATEKMPQATTTIFTNGVGLAPVRFDALREAGLKNLIFSLNAVRQEQHEVIMKLRNKFDITCANAKYACANAGSVHVEVRAVVDLTNFTAEDGIKFYEVWGNHHFGGNGSLILMHNWGGDLVTDREFDNKACCDRAIGNIYVMVDGTVTPCCLDPLGRFPLGNLKEQSIREIYNSTKYVSFREAHNENRADEFDICRGCTRC